MPRLSGQAVKQLVDNVSTKAKLVHYGVFFNIAWVNVRRFIRVLATGYSQHFHNRNFSILSLRVVSLHTFHIAYRS